VSHYWAELLVAALVIFAAVIAVASLPNSARGNPLGRTATYRGLITGIDNRYSTSKAVAVAWTVVVAWMVVAEGFIAAFHKPPQGTFPQLLSGAPDLYFVFLGGPFAAAAFAKANVQSKVEQGLLAKPPADTPTPSDLISDDNGNPDLYDFQYVLFNVLALLITIISFSAHPENHLPQVPDFLAILAGGSALTYTVNKAIAADSPAIIAVNPPAARIGDVITITGFQLFAATPGGPIPTVTIGAVAATGVTVPAGTTNTLTATVPAAPAGYLPLSGPVDIVVSTPLASPITAPKAINIVADEPTVTKVEPQPLTAGQLCTVTGTLLLAPGTPAGTAAAGTSAIGGVTPTLNAGATAWPVTIEGAYSQSELTLRIGPQPGGLAAPGPSDEATLTLTRGGVSCMAKVGYRLT
jgi:hypothetical protein